MKRFFILSLFMCIFLCGCTPIENMSVEEVIEQGTSGSVSVYNKYRKGYKYYLPRGVKVKSSSDYNEVLYSGKNVYYLYVDAVSFYNQIIETYEVNETSYISMPISYEDKYGYLEINELRSGKYFIEIMYNYAKIEVIVKKEDINVTLVNSMSILNSVDFNDEVLKSLLDEETSQFREFEFNIFETATTTESEYLEAIDSSVYDEEEEVHDSDLIN
ncbi:MAG: hypothetical protein IJ475_00230 [Bacilli bacterium]|nr:hypothetical protein [Bacilli bacterium]